MKKSPTIFIILIIITNFLFSCRNNYHSNSYDQSAINFISDTISLIKNESLIFYYTDINCSDCIGKIIAVSKKIKPDYFILLYSNDQKHYLPNIKNRLNSLSVRNITFLESDSVNNTFFNYFRFNTVYGLKKSENRYLVREISLD